MKKSLFFVCFFCIVLMGCTEKETNTQDLLLKKQQEVEQNDAKKTEPLPPKPNTQNAEQKPNKTSIEVQGDSVRSLSTDEQLILLSKQQQNASELIVKRLPAETLISINFFEGNQMKNVILYGNWNGNNFSISSYLGKEQVTITNISLHKNQKQILVTEQVGNHKRTWTYTQVGNEEIANQMIKGEIPWKL